MTPRPAPRSLHFTARSKQPDTTAHRKYALPCSKEKSPFFWGVSAIAVSGKRLRTLVKCGWTCSDRVNGRLGSGEKSQSSSQAVKQSSSQAAASVVPMHGVPSFRAHPAHPQPSAQISSTFPAEAAEAGLLFDSATLPFLHPPSIHQNKAISPRLLAQI
jgi:hypothetical protein